MATVGVKELITKSRKTGQSTEAEAVGEVMDDCVRRLRSREMLHEMLYGWMQHSFRCANVMTGSCLLRQPISVTIALSASSAGCSDEWCRCQGDAPAPLRC